MDFTHENWRDFLLESSKNEKEYVFSEQELRELNKSIAKIVDEAKKVLGAEGPTPILSPKMLQKVDISALKGPEKGLKMVAEGPKKPPKRLELVPSQDDVDEPEQPSQGDRKALRDKYYGPEGDLKKHGPRAIKNIPKPIRDLEVEDYEELGYVLKVPKEVIDDFETLVRSLKQVDGLYEEAQQWYHKARELITDETPDDRHSTLFGMLIAITSPQNPFAKNLAEAAFLYKAIVQDVSENKDGLIEYINIFPTSEAKKDWKPGELKGSWKSHKVPNFALNIIAPELAGHRNEKTGELEYNDFYMWNSTIDTWMVDSFYPLLKKASTADQWRKIKAKIMGDTISYRYLTKLVEKEARKFNLLPHELQAIIWVAMQIRTHGGDVSAGVTIKDAFGTIKEALINIGSIHSSLEEIQKELETNSVITVLFDKIDNEGYESAMRYAVGYYKEKTDKKGVVKRTYTNPGVRPLSMRGKGRDNYDYYDPKKVTEAKKKKEEEKDTRWKDSRFSNLKTYYVLNNVLSMAGSLLNNVHDVILLYLDSTFNTAKAVEFILGRFDDTATATKDYFVKESFTMIEALIANTIAKKMPVRVAIKSHKSS
jgi:hypothetical protein